MIMRIVVDLPEPFGPRKPVTTPGRTSNVRLSTAVDAPYRLVSECAVIITTNGKEAHRASGIPLVGVFQVGLTPLWVSGLITARTGEDIHPDLACHVATFTPIR